MSRGRNNSKCLETFNPSGGLFQKTPISILEELFPNQTEYTWAVARNIGCADLFRCRVNVPNSTNGESISFSKKVAKHQAALEALRNLQVYTQNKDLEHFIRTYVFGGTEMFSRRSSELGSNSWGDFKFRRRGRSISRSTNRSRSRSRSRSVMKNRNDFCPRSRSASVGRYLTPPNRQQHADIQSLFSNPISIPSKALKHSDPVGFLEEECRLIRSSGPEYSPPFNVGNELVVYATLGPFTSEGFGITRDIAQRNAAIALINSLFMDQSG